MTSNPALGQQPSRMKPADLAGAFGGSSRSDGLGGRLAPLRSVPAPAVVPETATPATVEQAKPARPEHEPSKTVIAQPATRSRRGATPASIQNPASIDAPESKTTPSAAAMQTIVVYVSASIRERLRNSAGERTFTAVVLAALDSTYGTLKERFAEPDAPTNSFFAGRGPSQPRRHSEPHVQVSLRPVRGDLNVIDHLVKEINAPNRSALINGALDEYLP